MFNPSSRWFPFALAALALLAASACAMQDHAGLNAEEYYKENPRENRVEQKLRSHVIDFGEDKSSGISFAERQAFIAFLGNMTPQAVDDIEIQTAQGDVSAPAYRKAIQALLSELGLAGKPVHWRKTSEVGEGRALVSISGLQVVEPNCPDWSQSADSNYGNHWHSSMRCASSVNLGRMVADPRDLVRGRGMTGIDPASATQAIEIYRAGAAGMQAGASSASGDAGAAASGGN